MFWFFIPLLIVVALIVIIVWIVAADARRRGGDGVRTPGQTVYDRDEQKKSPDAPPA